MSKNMLPCEFFVRGKRYTFWETSVSKEKKIYILSIIFWIGHILHFTDQYRTDAQNRKTLIYQELLLPL